MPPHRLPGPTCQVRNWFADTIDSGTSARVATAAPGPLDQQLQGLKVRFWHPPFAYSPFLGDANAEFLDFEQHVLDAHIVRSELKKHRSAATPIPETELHTVEGRFKLRGTAATRCRTLLQRARSDLQTAKGKGDALAMKVQRFGLTSAYRSPEYDEQLWRRYFRDKYYRINLKRLSKRSQFVVGARGLDRAVQEAAVQLVEFIKDRKAAPGFSNHSNGIAVDFFTREAGVMHSAETGKSDSALASLNRAFEKTWFYTWLNAHKDEFGVRRIPTEAWHWEFH